METGVAKKGEVILVEAPELSGGPPGLAGMFKALGDPTRLRIFAFLCRCGCSVVVDDAGDVRPAEGPTVGEICCRMTGMDRVSSTISFHLKELRLAGLITMERRGKNMLCTANRDAARRLADYLLDPQEGSVNANGCP